MFPIYRRKKNRLNNSEGQVAIEFILMFILVAFIVFYIWNLCIGISALQLREYATFMVGRAVTASYKTYDEKNKVLKMLWECITAAMALLLPQELPAK